MRRRRVFIITCPRCSRSCEHPEAWLAGRDPAKALFKCSRCGRQRVPGRLESEPIPEWGDLRVVDLADLRHACELAEAHYRRGDMKDYNERRADAFHKLAGWMFDMIQLQKNRKGWKE